jgi:hypothetical protein
MNPNCYKGAYFFHSKFLDPANGQSLRCKVTRIAQGTVYYRPHYGWHEDGKEWLGACSYFAVEKFDTYSDGACQPYIRHAEEVSKLHTPILAALTQ